MDAAERATFAYQHRRLDAQLRAHLLDLVGGELASALQRLQRWRAALARHIDTEQSWLLPHIPPGARWDARLYRVEHERILLLADEYLQRLRAAAAHPPRGRRAQHALVLELLDAAHALRHLLEHHHEREEMALAHELPAALQQQVWGARRRPGAPSVAALPPAAEQAIEPAPAGEG